MDPCQTLNELNEIFKDILYNPEIVLTADSTAIDVAEWDSLSHIRLVVAIEKKYKIRFTSAEIRRWKKAGDIVNNVQKKLNKI